MSQVVRNFELNEGQTYIARVRSINSFGVSSNWSESLVFTASTNTTSVNVPSGLTVVPAIRSLILTWNANLEPNFDHYEIYISNIAFGSSDPSSTYKYGDFHGTVASLNRYFNPGLTTPGWQDLFPGSTYYIKMRSVSTSGVFSAFSSQIIGTTGFLGNTDIVAETISADKIATGLLTAAVTVSGMIKTASGGARVELDPLGIRGYDNTGSTPNFNYSTSDGSVSVHGRIEALPTLNILNNSGFEDGSGIANYDDTTGLTAFQFDTGTNSWFNFVGTSTIAWNSNLANPSPVSGLGTLSVTSTVNTGFGAISPTGTSGVPVTPGFIVTVSAWVFHPTVARSASVGVYYYNSGGSFISGAGGTMTTTSMTGWVELKGVSTAPAGAAYMAVAVTTTAGAIDEVFYIDTVTISSPSITAISLNTNATYVYEGSKSLKIRATATGLTRVVTPPGQTFTNAFRVTAGDYYQMVMYYKNDAGNSTRKSVFSAMSWFSSTGSFVGTTIGTQPITTVPSSGWEYTEESFVVPAGVMYMRASILYFADSGDIVYVDSLTLKKSSIISGKILPQGSVANIDHVFVGIPDLPISTPSVWTAGGAVSVANPGIPVRVYAQAMGVFYYTAAVLAAARVGISFDGGLTWNYGTYPTTSIYSSDLLFSVDGAHPFAVGNALRGMPTDVIQCRLEGYPFTGSGILSLRGITFSIFIWPAPPAGAI